MDATIRATPDRFDAREAVLLGGGASPSAVLATSVGARLASKVSTRIIAVAIAVQRVERELLFLYISIPAENKGKILRVGVEKIDI